MAVYPDKIRSSLASARFGRRPDSANAAGTSANFECGSFLRFQLLIEPSSKLIVDIGYQSNGCGFMVAAAEVIAEKFNESLLTELHGVDHAELVRLVDSALDEFPEGRISCRTACIEALESALADFRAMQLEEFRGEKALICTCFGVTEERIEEVVLSGAASVDEVSRACNAGSGCGSCRMMIEELLDRKVG